METRLKRVSNNRVYMVFVFLFLRRCRDWLCCVCFLTHSVCRCNLMIVCGFKYISLDFPSLFKGVKGPE